MPSPATPPARCFQRLLAWLSDWAILAVVASVWYAWANPWLADHQDELPWPWSICLPWVVRLAPAAFALALALARDLGSGRRSLGMAMQRLGVEDLRGCVPGRGRMLARRGAGLLGWLAAGIGQIPAWFGSRRSLPAMPCLPASRCRR